MTREDIDLLVRAWLDQELAKDVYARSDTRFAEDWTRPGDDVAETAAHMLRGHSEDSLFEWQEAVRRHDWKKAEFQANALLSEQALELPKDSD